jgi:DNA-binding transcriptional LysR family regulator
MDLKQLEYIVAIAEEQSISRAADKLYITQSALNQQLLRLEKDLGLSLFSRIKHSMIPTYAGQVYLNTARNILQQKEETYKILHDISDMKRGEISLSYTPEQGSLMFSRVYPVFHKEYPQFTFHIIEARAKKMETLLEQGNVNLAVTAYREQKPQFDYLFTYPKLLVLALPISHPLASLAGSESWKTFPPIDLSLLKEEPFIMISHESRFRYFIDDLFLQAGFKPKILFEATSTHTAVNMVKSQIAPAFFPQSYVDSNAPMVYFSLGKKLSWYRSLICRKGTYLSKAEQALAELIRLDTMKH